VILVDTSVWVDHFRRRDANLSALLNTGGVLAHPFVIGELALGHLRQRDSIVEALEDLPQANQASHQEVLEFIRQNGLAGTGIGYVDAHLLASVRLTAGASLWTHDRRLRAAAVEMRLATDVPR
jgi:predicted nucleic acid-binding protein